ncbi:MAG: type VI secretion system baseplate subunit TssF [Phycisphaera sp.]|nr:MAG: type VI secretion system baseplate subunit TssF [Phycisphaera sp.]
MREAMLESYAARLSWLDAVSAQLGTAYPQLAPQLAQLVPGTIDPHVERLIEGVAFLAARVDMKLEAQEERIAHDLLATLVPGCDKQTPSAAVVRFDLDSDANLPAGGLHIDRGTRLRAPVVGLDQSVTFSVVEPVQVQPIRVLDCAMRSTGHSDAVLEISIETTNGHAWSGVATHAPESLRLYMTEAGESSWRLYDLLTNPRTRAFAETDAGGVRCPLSVTPIGLDASESMLPSDAGGHEGDRLVQEYLSFPQRFLGVSIHGWREAIQKASGTTRLVLELPDDDAQLARSINAESVAINCAACINLFPRRADPILCSDRRHEYHVQADRVRPQDYEIHTVLEVSGAGPGLESVAMDSIFANLARYPVRVPGHVLRRTTRVRSEAERRRGARTSYCGSDVFLAVVSPVIGESGSTSAPHLLSIRTLATNRDLPLLIRRNAHGSDIDVSDMAPLSSMRFVHGPTPPRPPRSFGMSALASSAAVSASRTPISGPTGRAILQSRWRSLAPSDDRTVEGLIAGLQKLTVEPWTRAFGAKTRSALVSGSRAVVQVDPVPFEGASILLFARVMSRYLSCHAPMNSFVDLRLSTNGQDPIDLADPGLEAHR